MTINETITAKSGVVLSVEKTILNDAVEVTIQTDNRKKCVLHWGIRRDVRAPWQAPPRSVWPEETRAFDAGAVQSPFLIQNGTNRIAFKLDRSLNVSLIDFVLYFPEENFWDNNSGQNYRIEIPVAEGKKPVVSPMEMLKKEIGQAKISYEHAHYIENEGQVAVIVSRDQGRYHVALLTDLPGSLILHWGTAKRSRYEWLSPPSSLYPPGTTPFGDKAAQTPFADHEGYGRLDFEMSESDAPMGIAFVLRQPDSGRWIKDQGRNFYIPIAVPPEHKVSLGSPELAGIADDIIEKEMSRNSWTLMHRFNLCYDLLDWARNNPEAKALIFVWLRFSALRQLDWQRNYNTKPRELGHALDRLTIKLGELYRDEPGDRELIRLILTTLGRGSDAQRVRDEVLHIMHRHHIKEVSGHFMEEWHQKLHNNTTADDIVICEAYLEFLRSNGNLQRFYERLEQDGVTKQRLESYERPIRSHPDFIPHLRDALIHDFQHFLGILKEVHSGTDLGTAIHNARYLYDEEMHRMMNFLWEHQNDSGMSVITLAEKITEARRRVKERLRGGGSEMRDLLFLDLALENFLRTLIERSLDAHRAADEMAALIGMVIENITLSREDETLDKVFHHWNRLREQRSSGSEWALQTKAVFDRLTQALGTFIDRCHRLLQPKAEFLGRAFHADSWTITLFTEEIVRGRIEFALSMLLRYFDPLLRREAHLGNWQIISRGEGIGQVKRVPDLKSVQGKHFDRPTILITDVVVGNEDISQGVIAVLTPDTTDIVSHVAIRARNAGLLFASCYDSETIARLKSFDGKWIRVGINANGDLTFEESDESAEEKKAPQARRVKTSELSRYEFTVYAVSSNDFTERNVGGKSNNTARLRGKLPEWIGLPSSAALPFGVFEKVLDEADNQEVKSKYEALIRRLGEAEDQTREEILAALRKTVLELKAPPELIPALRRVMNESGLSWPEEQQEEVWTRIKQVWGSKWNERAYLSRRAMGIPDERLFMAVLIQEVIEADYSYVIHTVNPFTGNRDEIYAEVVLGLGEALVANYPGRALSFTCKKGEREPHVLSFPSKSTGVYGGGLIFRSDSNGEDLTDYAGAGLYDSFILSPPRNVSLDYTHEPLVWDEPFRKDFLTSVALIGTEVENVMKSPQDIEGASSKGRWYVVQTRPQVGIE